MDGSDKKADAGESERGQRASFDRASGEVHGSGSGAGGGDMPEDFDSDTMAGGAAVPQGGPRPADEAEDRPIDPDEGV